MSIFISKIEYQDVLRAREDEIFFEDLIIRNEKWLKKRAWYFKGHPRFPQAKIVPWHEIYSAVMGAFWEAIMDFDGRGRLYSFYKYQVEWKRVDNVFKAHHRLKHRYLNDAYSLDKRLDEDDKNSKDYHLIIPAITIDPLRDLTLEWFDVVVERIEATLSPLEREVFRSRILDDVPYKEIAEKLGRTPKGIDNAFQRVKAKIADLQPELVKLVA